MAHLDETLRLEHREGLTQRRAADLEARCQLALGWEPFTNPEVGTDDEFAEALDQVLVKTGAAQRTERGGVEGQDLGLLRKKMV